MPTQSKYLEHIDGLRAVSVLAVIVYHAGYKLLPGGFLGVDAFFAISGFVVTAALADHRGESLGRFIVGFYHRRLTRILPALLVVLTLTCLAWVLLIPRSWLSGQAERVGLFAFAGLSNWALIDQSDTYFAPRAEFGPFTHTWSLGVEEQFYLLSPWLIFMVLNGRRVNLAAIAALALVSLGFSAHWTSSHPAVAFYGIVARFWELAAGALWFMLLWQGDRPRDESRVRIPAGLMAWGGAAVLAATFALGSAALAPFPFSVFAVLATLLLIGRRGQPETAVERALRTTPMRWIGLRSYSLYLWHWPIFVFMRWTVGLETAWQICTAVAASFLAAHASFRWVEMPIRSSARWRALPPWATTSTMVALAATCAGLAYQIQAHRQSLSLSVVERNSVDWHASHTDPTIAAPKCDGGGLFYRNLDAQVVIEHRPCARQDAPGRARAPQLFVLGDSHATAYLPMLHRLSVERGVAVSVYQVPGCPYVNLQAPMGTGRPPPCVAQPKLSMKDVLKRSGPGDVVLLASLRLPRFGDQWGIESDDAVLGVHFGAERAQTRHSAVVDSDSWIRPFLEHGLKVVMTAPTPIFRAPAFRCVDRWTSTNPICGHGLTEWKKDEITFREPVMRALGAVLERNQGAPLTLFDPFDTLCPGAKCSARDAGGRPLFFDADHVSRWANELLYPFFLAHWNCVTGPNAVCKQAVPASPAP